MLDHLPLLKTLKHDQWVKPFLKHYKRTLVLAIRNFDLRLRWGANVHFWVLNFKVRHPA